MPIASDDPGEPGGTGAREDDDRECQRRIAYFRESYKENVERMFGAVQRIKREMVNSA